MTFVTFVYRCYGNSIVGGGESDSGRMSYGFHPIAIRSRVRMLGPMSIDRLPRREPRRETFCQDFLDGVAARYQASVAVAADQVAVVADQVSVAADQVSEQFVRETVARKAYEHFERAGFRHGDDLLDWLKAEALVKSTMESRKLARLEASGSTN